MQWPPKPGPGVNFMKPNGLVAAASITSQALIPNFSIKSLINSYIPQLGGKRKYTKKNRKNKKSRKVKTNKRTKNIKKIKKMKNKTINFKTQVIKIDLLAIYKI